MPKSEALVPRSAGRTALETVAKGDSVEGEHNWHAVSAAIETILENLSHRSLPELLGSLRQLEDMLPDLAADIGLQADVLDLPKVGPVKKWAAIIFERLLPALHTIVRRAEMREEAAARLKNLERVRDQLSELRHRLANTIDEMLERNLAQTNPASYAKCQDIRRREKLYRPLLLRLEDLLKNRDNILKNSMNVDFSVKDQLNYGGPFSPYLRLWQEADEVSFNIAYLHNERSAMVRMKVSELVNRLLGIKEKIINELENLKAEREAILFPQVKALVGASDATLLAKTSTDGESD